MSGPTRERPAPRIYTLPPVPSYRRNRLRTVRRRFRCRPPLFPARHDHGAHDHGAHACGSGWRARLFHHHEPTVDSALESNNLALRTLGVSLAVLTVTGLIQLLVALPSGSVALLNDTLHNAVDAFTTLPLWIAFTLGRRPANGRFTYGFGRAEDLAGLAVVVMIGASVVLAVWRVVDGFTHPDHVHHLGGVMVAAGIGLAGNEFVARYRIRTGRRIGSAALVADGLHARSDALGSLGVLIGAVATAAGLPRGDTVAGAVIALMLVGVLAQSMGELLLRLMDGVRPGLAKSVTDSLRDTSGVLAVTTCRLRWLGHCLHCEAEVGVDPDLGLAEAHAISVQAEDRLRATIPRLTSARVTARPHLPAAPTQ